MFHLPRFNSDHLPILLRTDPKSVRQRPHFRCENWWQLKEGCQEVCVKAVENGGSDWEQTRRSFKKEVKEWVGKDVSPDSMLKKIESDMLLLNSSLPTVEVTQKELELQREQTKILLMHEWLWKQRSRINWIAEGDCNSRFFHATAVARKRRNTIRAVQLQDGTWETSEKGIRRAFQDQFGDIYKGSDVIPVW